MTQTRPLSLNEQIEAAEDSSEVHALLAQGHDWKFASPRARNRWAKTAKRRLAQLKEAK